MCSRCVRHFSPLSMITPKYRVWSRGLIVVLPTFTITGFYTFSLGEGWSESALFSLIEAWVSKNCTNFRMHLWIVVIWTTGSLECVQMSIVQYRRQITRALYEVVYHSWSLPYIIYIRVVITEILVVYRSLG